MFREICSVCTIESVKHKGQRTAKYIQHAQPQHLDILSCMSECDQASRSHTTTALTQTSGDLNLTHTHTPITSIHQPHQPSTASDDPTKTFQDHLRKSAPSVCSLRYHVHNGKAPARSVFSRNSQGTVPFFVILFAWPNLHATSPKRNPTAEDAVSIGGNRSAEVSRDVCSAHCIVDQHGVFGERLHKWNAPVGRSNLAHC